MMILFGHVFCRPVNFDSLVVKGIKEIYSIRFDDAGKTFRTLMADYPEHPAGKFFLAMIDWWKILLDLDNESYDDIFFAKLEDVIFMCDEILEKDPNNIDALFFKGGSIGFRGRLRAIRESWLKAADDGREAIPIVQHAAKLDPTNIDVQLGFGIYDYYAEVIPNEYPFVKPLMIFFPKGDKAKGIRELALVAEKGKYARIESRYFLMQLFFHYENDYKKAEEYAIQLTSEFPNNPLFQRYLGRIAVRKGDFFKSDEVFTSVYNKCVKGYPGYGNISRREATYYLGYYKKLINNIDSAMIFLKECIDISKKIDKDEVSGFRINATIYLGNMYDLKGEREKAFECYNECLELRDYAHSHDSAKRFIEKPYGKY